VTNFLPKGIAAFLDTNAALRYLWGDHPVESPPAQSLIEGSPEGSLYLSEVVVAEIVWSMHRKVPRGNIVDALSRLFENEAVWIDDSLEDAVANYAATNLDFADCLLAARSQATGLPVISCDQDYKKFRDVKVRTPAEQIALQGLR